MKLSYVFITDGIAINPDKPWCGDERDAVPAAVAALDAFNQANQTAHETVRMCQVVGEG